MSTTITVPMTIAVTEQHNTNATISAVVKVACGEEIRRVPLEARTIEKLQSRCGELFGFKNMKAWAFSYEDQEHDTVSIETDAELNSFLDYQASIGKCGVIRISRRKMKPAHKLARLVKTAQTTSETPKPVTRVPLTKLIPSTKSLLTIAAPNSKYVRLEINNEARRKNGKTGNYLGVSKCGKLICHAGKGRHGIWTLSKTTDGDLTLSPLDYPNRHLRMLPSGKVNLNHSKPGKWARWSLTKEKTDSVSLEGLKDIQLFSVANPGKALSIVQKENQKLTVHGFEIGAPCVLKCSFPVETVEAIDVLRIQAKTMSLEKQQNNSKPWKKNSEEHEKKPIKCAARGMLANPRILRRPMTPPTVVSEPSLPVPPATPKHRGAPFMRGQPFVRGQPLVHSPFLLRGAPMMFTLTPNSPNAKIGRAHV